MVLERVRGETVAEIGTRYGISHQRVSAVVANANRFVGRVYLDLMVAKKERMVVAYVIPYSEDYTLALDFSTWLIKRLQEEGLDIQVETRRASNGIALLLSDVSSWE